MRAFFLCAALLGGCFGGDDGTSNRDSGSSRDMATSTNDFGACASVQVTPMSGTAPVTLTAMAFAQTLAMPVWSVQTPSGIVVPMPLGGDALRVSLQATLPGDYVFRVEFPNTSVCLGQAVAHVLAPDAVAEVYRVRVTPPTSSGLPQQDGYITVYGGTPQTTADVTLAAGTSLGGVLRGPSGSIAGEVQLFPASGPQLRVAVDASGSFSLPVRTDPDAMYRVVLVPADPALAPHLIGPLNVASLLSASFTVGTGVAVTGVLHDEMAAPIAGAHVVLRAGILPSGLGATAADGSFSLRAEPRDYAFSSSASAWPDLSFDPITVGASGASITVDAQLARLAVGMRVVRADGVTPVAGARVTLRSVPIDGAASIDIGAGPQAATGIVRSIFVSTGDGTLGSLSLPAGTYDVLIEPATLPADASEGRTGLRVVVSSAGEILLPLAPRADIAGHVRDAAGNVVAGARVRLRAQTGGPTVETKSDDQGAYTLSFDRGLPLELVVDPPANAPLASARRLVGNVTGAFGVAPPVTLDVSLPKGLQIAGAIRGPSAGAIGNATVEILCLSCGDPTPIARTESDASGSYRVGLPDPGLSIDLDAGTLVD